MRNLEIAYGLLVRGHVVFVKRVRIRGDFEPVLRVITVCVGIEGIGSGIVFADKYPCVGFGSIRESVAIRVRP